MPGRGKPKSGSPLPPNGKCVLLVDDDAAHRVMLSALLQYFGYDVIEIADGTAAIRQARRKGPDLIVLDLVLEGISGVDAARALVADHRTHGVPLLAITGYPFDEEQVQAAGFDGIIEKPFTYQRFIDEVKRLTP